MGNDRASPARIQRTLRTGIAEPGPAVAARSRARAARCAVALLAAFCGIPQVFGQASETSVKAAFLYRFCDYVEWPAQSFAGRDNPLVIGVLGADALAQDLMRQVAGRTSGGRPIAVRRLRRGDPLSSLHVLFVGREAAAQLPEVLAAVREGATLTVTEAEGALEHGSIINFVVVDQKVRFDVSLASLERRDLKISARLLAVARRVVGGPAGGAP